MATPPRRREKEDWVRLNSKHLVDENFKWLEKQAVTHGPEMADTLLINFIACLIGATLHKKLTSVPDEIKSDKKAAYEYLCDSFADVKLSLQDAVAAGFTGALSKFSGKDIEYYCTVKPVGDAVNRLPC